ncbi:hypothetical protein HK105_205908 [Polyrhizophydium stewartii]|uniref:Uncharacterized protein n=1 Tax=Polyrhizophydium stewartii TaxID=2732419 RepID=A0ABR4N4S1_9FUNG
MASLRGGRSCSLVAVLGRVLALAAAAAFASVPSTSAVIIRSQTPHNHGNRTHYPSGLPRNGSDAADPSFSTNGAGVVGILALPSQAPSPKAQAIQNLWAAANAISIEQRMFDSSSDYSDYLDQLLLACSNMQRTAFDIVWIDATMTAALENCLVDLWAWDSDFGAELTQAVVANGVVRDKLVALPAEVQATMLFYNKDYLSVHGYDDPPATFAKMQEMLESILVNEHAVENWKLSGYTSSFKETEDWPILASEWIAGTNASIIDASGNITVADSDFAVLLTHIVGWINTGLIDPGDLDTFTSREAFSRWANRQAVFLHATSALLPDAAGVSFQWGVQPMPPLIPAATDGKGTSVSTGFYLGVYKYARNPAAAVKLAKYLVSSEYERQIILQGAADGRIFMPVNPSLMADQSVVEALGKPICDIYANSYLTLRPNRQSGSRYANVSELITGTMNSIFHGALDVLTALDELDLSLRAVLGKPPRNATDADTAPPPVVTRPGAKKIRFLSVQVACLFFVMAVTVTVVLLLRRKSLIDQASAAPADTKLPTSTLQSGSPLKAAAASPEKASPFGTHEADQPLHSNQSHSIQISQPPPERLSRATDAPREQNRPLLVAGHGAGYESAGSTHARQRTNDSFNEIALDHDSESARLIR